jgi:hypothetical protein
MGTHFFSALQPGDLPRDSLLQALTFIRSIIRHNKQHRSFGTIIRFSADRKLPAPAIIFGFAQPPEDDIGAELFIDSNSTIPIMVFRGGLDGAVTAPTSWLNQAVKEYARLNINDASVGGTGILSEATSFGGYLRTASGTILGLTAAHPIPSAVGEEICSPSTVEVTGRLKSILRYTGYDPDPIKIRPSSNTRLMVFLRIIVLLQWRMDWTSFKMDR